MRGDLLDARACALYLEVPASRVVWLQGFFENYEGLGTVRTLDSSKSLVCVLTTPSLERDCIAALEALRPQTAWRAWSNAAEARSYLKDICVEES